MTTLSTMPSTAANDALFASSQSTAVAFPPSIPESARGYLQLMFRDPNLLDRPERAALVEQLKSAVALEPRVPELRVLLGMALCVNFDGQSAMEELREACRLDPCSYIAQLKLGELLMRLRICDQAAIHTRLAAELATTSLQAELARRQATTIRTMQREGIERGNYGKMLSVFRFARGVLSRKTDEQSAITLNPR